MNNNEEGYISIVLGKAGVGKSCFINSITKSRNCKTSDGPEICTTKYNITKTTHNKSNYYFIDTPGFDYCTLQHGNNSQIFLDEFKKVITEYPKIRCLIILFYFYMNSHGLDNLKKIKESFPVKNFLEHVIVVRTKVDKHSPKFLWKKESSRKQTKIIMNCVNDGSNDLSDYLSNKNIEQLKDMEEYYVDCREDEYDNFENNEVEFNKIFDRIKNTPPIFN